MNYNGKIKLIIGPMFSGKTSELLSRYRRWKLAGKKVLMIKYKQDNRYDKNNIVTHDGISVNARVCERLQELDDYVNNYDVICVDEVQFYDDADEYCDKWANMGKVVEASGLNGNYLRKPFKIISNLIPLAEDIHHLNAVCKETGNDASFSVKFIKNDQEIFIGNDDSYLAGDRLTWHKVNKELKIDNKKFKE